MRYVVAVALAAHGVAHLVGFVVPWRLMTLPEPAYKTTVLGDRVDLGDAGIRVVGVLWLIAAVSFVASAAAWAFAREFALAATVFAVSLSSALCLAEWPAARLGALVNLMLVLLLMLRLHVAIALGS
jgi:hypothetical protein